MPISTFPRHDDYDEDEYLLKTGPLRDTRSEGKVNFACSLVILGSSVFIVFFPHLTSLRRSPAPVPCCNSQFTLADQIPRYALTRQRHPELHVQSL